MPRYFGIRTYSRIKKEFLSEVEELISGHNVIKTELNTLDLDVTIKEEFINEECQCVFCKDNDDYIEEKCDSCDVNTVVKEEVTENPLKLDKYASPDLITTVKKERSLKEDKCGQYTERTFCIFEEIEDDEYTEEYVSPDLITTVKKEWPLEAVKRGQNTERKFSVFEENECDEHMEEDVSPDLIATVKKGLQSLDEVKCGQNTQRKSSVFEENECDEHMEEYTSPKLCAPINKEQSMEEVKRDQYTERKFCIFEEIEHNEYMEEETTVMNSEGTSTPVEDKQQVKKRKRSTTSRETLNAVLLKMVEGALKEDESQSIGRGFVFQLKQLRTDQQIFAMKLMNDVLFYAKLNKLNEMSRIETEPCPRLPFCPDSIYQGPTQSTHSPVLLSYPSHS